ncbi:MAG TPA: zf-HC2 domain-containing protein [Longimicrobiaceae bacterium]|nr:zf-HC2 domain-containing protein [Longimicrobiaceae bacterium]
MNMTTRPVPHLTEGELVQHLDGELSAADRERVLAHAATCGECVERLRALQAQSDAFAELVVRLPAPRYGELRRARTLTVLKRAETQASARRRSGSRWPLRAAASVAVIFTAAFTVEPVRAWMMEQWEGLTTPTAIERAGPLAANETTWEASPQIAFEPVGEVFVLELRHPQRRGTVTLRVADVPQATAQVVGRRAEDLLVLPNGIRIENAADASADYLLTLPAGLRLVRLRPGSAPEITIPLDGVAARTLVFDLGSRQLRR